MSDPARILYRAAQRKRVQLGWEQDRKQVGGQTLVKIKKRTRIAWIRASDIEKAKNVETEKEAGQGAVDADERRTEAETIALERKLVSKIMEENSANLKSLSNTLGSLWKDEGLGQDAAMLGGGKAEPGNGQADLFNDATHGNGQAPRRRKNREPAQRSEQVDGPLRNGARLGTQEQGGSKANGHDACELERDRAKLEAEKKRVIRKAVTIGIWPYVNFITRRACENDTRFFIRLGKALAQRKQKKAKTQ